MKHADVSSIFGEIRDTILNVPMFSVSFVFPQFLRFQYFLTIKPVFLCTFILAFLMLVILLVVDNITLGLAAFVIILPLSVHFFKMNLCRECNSVNNEKKSPLPGHCHSFW